MIRILALCMLATTAHADLVTDSFGLVIGSHHINADREFEEFNPGIYVSFDGVIDTQAAVFRNSLGDNAFALSFSTEYLSLSAGGFSATPFLGAAYYGDGAADAYSINGWIPLGGLRIEHESNPLSLQIMPCPPKECDLLLALTLEISGPMY